MQIAEYEVEDCEEMVDLEYGRSLVCSALTALKSHGRVTKVLWNCEVGDSGYIWFTIEEQNYEKVWKKISELEEKEWKRILELKDRI